MAPLAVPKPIPKGKLKMASNIENRVTKLERVRGAERTFVIRVSDPMTKLELALLAAAKADGRPVALVPHVWTGSSEDWAVHAGAAAAARRVPQVP